MTHWIPETRIAELEQENRMLRHQLRKQEQVITAADRVRRAYDAMLDGEPLGVLPAWSADLPRTRPE